MDRDGITCAFDAPVAAIDVGTDGNATAVRTRAASYPADVVVLALGVRPETALAANAGLPLGAAGGILTDDHQRVLGTENIWAAGDCVETFHRLLGCPVHIPLGTHANKQGFIAGSNIAGADLTFPGVIGTAITKVADTHRAHRPERAAGPSGGIRRGGSHGPLNVIAGYMPNPGEMATKPSRKRGRDVCWEGRSSVPRSARLSGSTPSRRRSGAASRRLTWCIPTSPTRPIVTGVGPGADRGTARCRSLVTSPRRSGFCTGPLPARLRRDSRPRRKVHHAHRNS